VVRDGACGLETAPEVLLGSNLKATHAKPNNLFGLYFLANHISKWAEGVSVDLHHTESNV
jgi:hypothetical protein